MLEFAQKDPFGVAIVIMLYTGMRSGELRALLWSDIDFQNNTIAINKAINRTQEIDQTKTGKELVIPIPRKVSTQLRKKQGRDLYVLGGDTFLKKETFEREYKAFFKRLEEKHPGVVEYKSPHIMRHTVATVLLENNVDLAIRQMMLGHSTEKVSVDYSHTNLELLRKTIEKVSL